MDILDENLSAYIAGLYDRLDDPVLLQMETLAVEREFPIVGRVCGATLEMLARSIDARRVFELGSGFGYSAWWFARAVGPQGSVSLTDGDEENIAQARDYLERAGLKHRCTFLVGDAFESLNATQGDFDVIYCDIDKGDYPEAFRLAAERLRVGGMYMCDNVLWKGKVTEQDTDDEWTRAIQQHNEAIYADDRFLTTIIPIRDGILCALRIK
ncbi:MAG: O-methyltransferase [Actinomycetota bacterium]